MSKRKKDEKVRGKIDKNNEAGITCERLILVCQIANGALELIIFFFILFKIIYYDKKNGKSKVFGTVYFTSKKSKHQWNASF